MAHILIVEDEININNLMKRNLELVGHTCSQVFDGNAAADAVASGGYDLLILDVMLPGFSGFDLIGQADGTPVIFVTAKGGLEDRLRGLRLGADDYIVKPFEILELVARVDVVLRRTHATSNSFSFDDIRVEFDSRKVFKNGEEIGLKPKEYELLEALIRNRNLALSREKLLNIVWDYDYAGDARTVDVHIQKLRKKLGLDERLKTVYKTGYRLEV
ncbi:MAG: response regulator transcription factor [Oscillospiraceae bacterium]|nr:response regulator transcription factor [Oscillospiraceae bacterium]